MISTTEILAIRLLDTALRKYYRSSLQECYAQWASTQLMIGHSSYHLNILAGVTFSDNYFEVDSFFIAALKELNISLSDQKNAINNFVIELCQKTLSSDIPTKEACNILASIALETDDDDYLPWLNLANSYEYCMTDKRIVRRIDRMIKEEAKLFLETHL